MWCVCGRGVASRRVVGGGVWRRSRCVCVLSRRATAHRSLAFARGRSSWCVAVARGVLRLQCDGRLGARTRTQEKSKRPDADVLHSQASRMLARSVVSLVSNAITRATLFPIATVMLRLQVLVFPQSSVAVQVRVTVEVPAQEPGVVWSSKVMSTLASQASLAEGPANDGMAGHSMGVVCATH